MELIDLAKATATSWVDANRTRLSAFHQTIWNFAEPAWREYRSAAAYRDLLGNEGFSVEEGSGGMPTAFVATWQNGDGPVVGGYAEYDAVPASSQAAVPYSCPRADLHPWAAGHIAHSALGVGALGGMLATKAAMIAHGIAGKLVFLGEPAEKVCGSKPVHAAKGYLDGFDAFVSYHPMAVNTTVLESHPGAYWSAVFTFETPTPHEWIENSLASTKSMHAAAARAPGALDALCMVYTLNKYLRESMFPNAGGWSMNEFVLAGGDATADNMSPRFSQIQYSWRSHSLDLQQHIERVLTDNARHVARITGTRASLRWVSKTRVGLPNHAFARIAYDNMRSIGVPSLGEEATDFARQIQSDLDIEPMEQPFTASCLELTAPEDYEAQTRATLPEWQAHSLDADDYVEYTWHAPTVRLYTQRPKLRPPAKDYEYPAWSHAALGAVPEIVDPGIFFGAKVISNTFLDLLMDPLKLSEVRAEFVERTGGGVHGSKWVAPLLPKDFIPPTELHWPEYTTTSRGHEWWLPTAGHGSGAGEEL